MLHINRKEPKTPPNLCVEEFALGEGGLHRCVRPLGNSLIDIAPSRLKNDQELVPCSVISESANDGRRHGIVTRESSLLSSTCARTRGKALARAGRGSLDVSA